MCLKHCYPLMRFLLCSTVLVRMSVSVEIVLALILVVLIRLSGCPSHLRNHPVLGPFFKVDPLYLDSLVEHLCLPPDEVVEFVSFCVLDEFRWPLSFQSLPCCLPQLWTLWCSVYTSASRKASVSPRPLRVLSCAALVLSSRLLRAMVREAAAQAADGEHLGFREMVGVTSNTPEGVD